MTSDSSEKCFALTVSKLAMRFTMNLLLVLFAAGTARATDVVSFQKEILPLLTQRCQMCHQGNDPQGKLALNSYKNLLQGGQSGAVVKPGASDESSLLVQYISGDRPRMPKVGPPLTSQEVELIRRWVTQGAKDDGSTETQVGQETWWSLQPLAHHRIPQADSTWARTPMDAFVLAKLQQKGLTPSPEADKRTLIRRLSVDLHGLPPTLEEL